jgi:aminobenzoyl-glutamate utilization protein B
MHDIPLPVPTEEELEYGKKLQATTKLTDEQKTLPPFSLKVLDPAPPVAHGGSTDTADVSWNCPTVQMHVGCWIPGSVNHSWHTVTQGKNGFARRAMLYTGKALALAAVQLFEAPELLAEAKKEHLEKTGGVYNPAMPADVMPKL